jgi:hypothetical protein
LDALFDPWEAETFGADATMTRYGKHTVSASSISSIMWAEKKQGSIATDVDAQQRCKAYEERITSLERLLQKSYAISEKNQGKLAFQEPLFGVGDVVLFLPTVKAGLWAAFHPGAKKLEKEKRKHYYLSKEDYQKWVNGKREWIARGRGGRNVSCWFYPRGCIY